MSDPVQLSALLPGMERKPTEELALFALFTLGIIESLANGLLSATDAVRCFFNAENCLWIRKRFKKDLADRIMSHGVQLPDLFEALSAEESYREFQRELATMRSLCLKLLDERKRVA